MVITSLLLLVLFAVYCYVPYLAGRAVIGEVDRVRPPYANQFIEFVTAAVPGGAFNAAGALIAHRWLRREIGVIDWRVISGLFDLSRPENAFVVWLRTASLRPLIYYFVVVISVAVVWSLIAAVWLNWIAVGTTPSGGILSRIVGLSILFAGAPFALPFFGALHDRFQERGWHLRRFVIICAEDVTYFGKVQSYEFAADRLVGVILLDATIVRSLQEVLAAIQSAEKPEFSHTPYTLYVPGEAIHRSVSLSSSTRHESDSLSDIARITGLRAEAE